MESETAPARTWCSESLTSTLARMAGAPSTVAILPEIITSRTSADGVATAVGGARSHQPGVRNTRRHAHALPWVTPARTGNLRLLVDSYNAHSIRVRDFDASSKMYLWRELCRH